MVQIEFATEPALFHQQFVLKLNSKYFGPVWVFSVGAQYSFRPSLRHRYIPKDSPVPFVQIIYDVIVVVPSVVRQVFVGQKFRSAKK